MESITHMEGATAPALPSAPGSAIEVLPEVTAGTADAALAREALKQEGASDGGVGVLWIQGIIGVPAGLGTAPDELIVQPLVPALPPLHVPREAVSEIAPVERLVPLPAKYLVRVKYLDNELECSICLAPLGSGEQVDRDLLLHRLATWRRWPQAMHPS
jgi:hypothetical protein